MNWLFDSVIEASWQASVLVVLVLLIQWTLRRRLSPGWRCAMWLLVVARLMLPVVPESSFSIFGFVSPAQSSPTEAARTTIIYGTIPEAINSSTPEPAAKSLAPSRQINWRPILMSLWLLIAFLLFLRQVISHIRFTRRLRRLPHSSSQPLLDVLDECRTLLRLTARPRLVETSLVNIPAVTGIIHPTILIPPDSTHDLSPQQLRFVLLHELVHLKRRDLLVGWLVAILKSIHWFNPILWHAFARYRADRELACDAHVLSLTGESDHRSYGQTLIQLVENLTHSPRPIGAVAIVEGRSSLRRRISAIARPVVAGRWWSILIGLILIAVVAITYTRPKKVDPLAIDTSDPNTRVYDIRDLLVTVPDFRDEDIKRDEFGWPIMTNNPTTEPSRAKLLAEIVELIKDTIATDSWTDRGGSTGSIQEHQGQLIVTQSPANHDQLGRLLAQLRSKRGVQIVVECRFLTSDDALKQLREILGPDHDLAKAGSFFLTDEQSQALVRAMKESNPSATLSAPRITLFNGQRAFVMVATETAYVAEFTEKSDKKFEPIVKTVNSGLVFDCQATATADYKYVMLKLRPHLSRLMRIEPVPWPKAPADRQDLKIQVPMLETVSYNTTVSVPDGGWLVTAWKGGPTMGSAQNPLMMVRPTIIDQTEIPQTLPARLRREEMEADPQW
jgi:beta-lactamase regulating signal transducer with metallopeptidase domain